MTNEKRASFTAGDANDVLAARIARTLRDVPDFPSPGILFKDITPVLADPLLLRDVIAAMSRNARALHVTHVVGIESRGFLFGVPVALALGVPFVPVRKPGKLPWTTVREEYALEYRSDVLEIHADAFGGAAERSMPPVASGQAPAGSPRAAIEPINASAFATSNATPRVLVVDDVLATGGTAAAAGRLVRRVGGDVAAVSVLVELGFLDGRAQLDGVTVQSLLRI